MSLGVERHRGFFMLELLLAIDVTPHLVDESDSVYYIPEVPESGGEYIGAVGHLISALMQTSGLMAQGDVLAAFSGYLTSVGALIYVYALIVAIFSIALFGNYKQALYLFIGPVLFYWMLTATVPVQGTMVRYGSRITEGSAVSQRQFLALVDDLGVTNSNPEVAWAFVLWDNLVTEVVQRMVSVLLDTGNLEDLKQAATERVYTKVLQHQGSDPGMLRLLATGVLGECAEQTTLSREIAAGGSPQDIARLQNRLDWVSQQQQSLDMSARRYLSTLTPSATALSTCPNAAVILNRVVGEQVALSVSCKEVWSLTCVAAINEAEVAMRGAGSGLEGGIEWEELRGRVQQSIAQGGSEAQATQILAAYIIKNTLRSSSHGQLARSLGRKANFRKHEFNVIFGPVADAEAKGTRLGLIFFSSMVPYLQGFLLFLLSMVFPFFCVFLILPDRWTVFFIWMSLWLWVKCWDIGFAVVHFIKLFLWEFMQGGVSTPDVDWSQPESVFRIIYENDPLATTNTYFKIVALLTISVPFVTAHFATGARHLYRAFGSPLEQTTAQFDQRYGIDRKVRDGWSSAETASTRDRDIWALQETMKHYGDFNWDKLLAEGKNPMDASVPREIRAMYMMNQAAYMYDGRANGRWADTLSTVAAFYTRIDPWNADKGAQTEGVAKLIARAHQLGIGRKFMDLLSSNQNSGALTYGPAGGGQKANAADDAGR